MINRVSFLTLSLVLSLTISWSQAQTSGRETLRKMAEQGDAEAQFFLGIAYDLGEGVPKDSVLTYMWYNLAASKLKGEPREKAAELRDGLAKRMTRGERSKAQRLAREWAEKHRK